MIPKPTPVKVTLKDKTSGQEAIVKTHPSFGMVGLYRTSGSAKLFGSEIESSSYMTLRIVEASEEWHLSQKWHNGGKQIIEIKLTPAQYAELISTPNVGQGVPCTIDYRERDGVIPAAIDEDSLHDQIKADLQTDTKRIVALTKQLRAELTEVLAETNLSKAKQERLTKIADRIVQDISSNMPFALDQYKEAADKVTSSAKAEIDSFLTHVTHQLGIKSLQDIAKLTLTEGNPQS